ncbi:MULTISPECIES: hypothetical protein [unclassified Tolypothrix]|uniref:hypothetical protein n=1 Tax=unclassified Tolypothrix TaxID=2649714 RepID=UPI0005EAA59C|nr:MULTISPECIES: hypothetical protein [unclassified Tolypothrix]BAY95919.1 hypothetical protein NIES3275_79960 [Microchaete diplosiphon NIES-3275]EKE96544.1 hypothetical protein FDUTEX481_06553 [Tolypothrix sp. PCC 7601]MBE9084721.1 hypothetical protein [Tolypothrix sp. LEGE 11397]UYD30945.1 hypothetical protein HGR01_39505 [Tolypothrix sp. PCC 7712]UYD38807.1 hypothetical protein HG267_40665 [Tolypothrix sp. PCC 7601]
MEFSPDIHQPVPQLATKETASLRADYPCIEHLEAGNIAPWLVERLDQLLVRAKTERAGMNLAKCVTLATASIGAVCYATSPLAPIGALVAGLGYAWSVVQDMTDSHCFAPIPFMRGNFLEFLAAMGDSEARAEWLNGSNEIVDLMNHLTPTERSEFVMLRQYTNTLTDFLTSVEAGKRFYAYRWLLDNFTTYRGAFPTVEQLCKHLAQVAPDPRIDHAQVTLIQQQSQLPQPKLPSPKFVELPQPHFVQLPSPPKTEPAAQAIAPDIQAVLALPLHHRAIAIIDALTNSGFDIAKCIRDQITVIAGNQRGGKGTLMAILAILSKALEPNTKIHYFSAGDDIYPFQCHHLVCRLSYPQVDGAKADAKVAGDLYQYLREMDNANQNSYIDIILVIDEAVALSDYLSDEQKQWIIRFLFTRASKKGAQIFVVLHGKNLTSWVGTKNTAGFGDTFKSGATFIGCEATSKKLSPLKSISLSTGRYFLADPDSFDKPVAQGEIGTIPEWLKTEVNPHSLQPDPARTLLQYFPEYISDCADITDRESPDSLAPDEFLNQARAWINDNWVIPDAPPPTLSPTPSDTDRYQPTDKAFEEKESFGIDTDNDTGISDTIPENCDSQTLASDTGNDTETRYTPAELTPSQLTSIVKQMMDKKMSQTQIIQTLWGVEKNGKGWKQAYTEYKELFP